MEKITTTEAAKLLGTSRSSIRKAIAHGRIKAEKAGRDWVMDPSEIKLPKTIAGRPRRGFRKD